MPIGDVAHGLEFLLAVLQPAFEVVEGAADVFEVQPHVLPGLLVLLELDPAVGPEGDFLGQPLVDGGEGLVHMGDAASGDFAEVLRDERGGGEGEGRCSWSARIHGASSRSVSSGRSAAASGSRSRCGAQPAKAAVPSGVTRTNCSRLERTVPSPDLISWVSRKSSEGCVAVVGRVDEDRRPGGAGWRAAPAGCR